MNVCHALTLSALVRNRIARSQPKVCAVICVWNAHADSAYALYEAEKDSDKPKPVRDLTMLTAIMISTISNMQTESDLPPSAATASALAAQAQAIQRMVDEVGRPPLFLAANSFSPANCCRNNCLQSCLSSPLHLVCTVQRHYALALCLPSRCEWCSYKCRFCWVSKRDWRTMRYDSTSAY